MLYDAVRWEPKLPPVKTKKKSKQTSEATYKRRLLKLADMLERDAKNAKGMKFDLGVIGVVGDIVSKVKLDCNTTGCAIGLAAISGQFQKAGLSYKFVGPWIDAAMHGRRTTYESAAKRVFGVSREEAVYLFSPQSYPVYEGAQAELAVAKRIRQVVAGKHALELQALITNNPEPFLQM